MDSRREGLDQVTFVVHRPAGQFVPAILALFILLTIAILTLSAAFHRHAPSPQASDSTSQAASAAGLESMSLGGAAWSVVAGDWSLEGDAAVRASRDALLLIIAAAPAYRFELRMKSDGAGYFEGQMPRILFNYQSPEDYYAVYPAPDGDLVLGLMSGGLWTRRLLSAPVGADPRAFHLYQIEVAADRMQIWYDGEMVIAFHDAALPALRQIGIGTAYGPAVFADLRLTYPTVSP